MINTLATITFSVFAGMFLQQGDLLLAIAALSMIYVIYMIGEDETE